MRALKKCIGILWIMIIGYGCATVETDQEWARLKKSVLERTGQEIIWEQTSEEESIVRNEVDKLLDGSLSREEAIRIALINNRELQGTLEKIGIAKSDLIQAGLFHLYGNKYFRCRYGWRCRFQVCF